MKIFYQQSAVQTVLHPDGDTTLLRARDTPLAEHCSSARSQSLVLGCDQQGSPLSVMSANASRTGRYTPYGFETTLPSATGFTGQLKAWSLPGYFLGSGYRFFNTVLMRFHSPDSFSPFAAGGINAYMYCGGDPVNRIDPSGHMKRSSSGSLPLLDPARSAIHTPPPPGSAVDTVPLQVPVATVSPGSSGRAVTPLSSSSAMATVSAPSPSSLMATVSGSSQDLPLPTNNAIPQRLPLPTANAVFSNGSRPSLSHDTMRFERRNLADPTNIGGLSAEQTRDARTIVEVASRMGRNAPNDLWQIHPSLSEDIVIEVMNSVIRMLGR